MTVQTPHPSLAVEEVPIDLLHPDPANPRQIGADELDALERSLRQFGFVQPVVASATMASSSAAISASWLPAGSA